MSAIQKLHDVCKASFSLLGAVPSPPAIQTVRNALGTKRARLNSSCNIRKLNALFRACHARAPIKDNIECADVGLDWKEAQQDDDGFGYYGLVKGCRGRLSAMVPRWAQPITYLHLYEKENFFSMGIFCLPTSAAIPLHNHPGMTVFSRLLYGSMHVRSYDWVNPFSELSGDASTPRLAKLVADHVLTAPCESAVLFPASGGNIHAFTALTPCAVLDVLTPPYSPIDGRHCIYYRESKFCGYPHDSTESEQELDLEEPIYVWLEESQPSSDDFVIQEGFYKGPKIKP